MAEVGQVDAPAAMVEATAINTRNMWGAMELNILCLQDTRVVNALCHGQLAGLGNSSLGREIDLIIRSKFPCCLSDAQQETRLLFLTSCPL
jgi:hypothetical protein